MKNYYIVIILSVFYLTSCSLTKDKKDTKYNVKYVYYQKGEASWYGPGFNGKMTANGEIFNTEKLTAAHKKLPFGTIVRVTNLNNNKRVIVRINDRGPFVKGRVIDLSKKAALEIDMIGNGVVPVIIDIVKEK